MSVRKFLNTLKQEFELNPDEELSDLIGVSNFSLNKWIQRNKIPDKWRYIIKEKLGYSLQYNNRVKIIGNNTQSNIVNDDIHINISQFDHKEDIKEIIKLLPNAPSKFLKKLKLKLKSFEELSEI